MGKLDSKPLITIGLPTFNTPIAYFDLLIEQILRQTYPHFDLLIVDDGSEKNFVEHLKEIKAKDSRVRLILKEKNTGIYDTRNIILQNIKAELFTFVDSDDYIPLDYLERLLEGLKKAKHECSFSYCTYEKFESGVPAIAGLKEEDEIVDEGLLRRSLKGEFSHSLCCRLIPSRMLVGLTIDPNVGFDDAQLVPQICKRCKSIVKVNSTRYFYRQRQGSIIHSDNKTLFQAYRTFLAYLGIARNECPEMIPYLEIMAALSEVKLCSVAYDENFSKTKTKEKSKALKKLIRKYGYADVQNEANQIFLAVHFPMVFGSYLIEKDENKLEIEAFFRFFRSKFEFEQQDQSLGKNMPKHRCF